MLPSIRWGGSLYAGSRRRRLNQRRAAGREPAALGGEIGFRSVLHTWGQTLQRHPHVHCVVPGGGLSPDHKQSVRSPPNFFLPVKVLSRVFERSRWRGGRYAWVKVAAIG